MTDDLVDLGPHEERTPPSGVFGRRLLETRRARGKSQRELARVASEIGGVKLGQVAIARIEAAGRTTTTEEATRRVTLDEALLLCYVLEAAPAAMLSPTAGERVWITPNRGYDGSQLRNWLLFADPALVRRPGRRLHARLELVSAVEVYARAIVDALRSGDEAGKQEAAAALEEAILAHHKRIDELVDEETS